MSRIRSEPVFCRRAGRRGITFEELPLAQALSAGETVRLEEIVMEVPDGRSAKTLINAAPIHLRSAWGNPDIYVMNVDGSSVTRLTDHLWTACPKVG